jgi:hypothetical protein
MANGVDGAWAACEYQGNQTSVTAGDAYRSYVAGSLAA